MPELEAVEHWVMLEIDRGRPAEIAALVERLVELEAARAGPGRPLPRCAPDARSLERVAQVHLEEVDRVLGGVVLAGQEHTVDAPQPQPLAEG